VEAVQNKQEGQGDRARKKKWAQRIDKREQIKGFRKSNKQRSLSLSFEERLGKYSIGLAGNYWRGLGEERQVDKKPEKGRKKNQPQVGSPSP